MNKMGAVLVAAFASIGFVSAVQADARFVPPFVDALKEGNYEQANFYVQQAYITQSDIRPEEVLFDIIDDEYDWKIAENANAIDSLIAYLTHFGAFDLNRAIPCESNEPCGFAYHLITNAVPTANMDRFVQLGLDLNASVPG